LQGHQLKRLVGDAAYIGQYAVEEWCEFPTQGSQAGLDGFW